MDILELTQCNIYIYLNMLIIDILQLIQFNNYTYI